MEIPRRVQEGWFEQKRGTKAITAIVSPIMATNPDPKPGRWILPLVILGMVGFTYFFVSALPEASPNTTLAGATNTTTTLGEGTGTTQPGGGGPVDDATQVYLDELDSVNAQLQVLETELVTVNDAWDADPKEIEFDDIESRMEAVAADTQALADLVAALTIPPGLESNHTSLTAAIDLAATAASEALEGLRSSDTGEFRRAAVAAYVSATSDFDTEAQNAHSSGGG